MKTFDKVPLKEIYFEEDDLESYNYAIENKLDESYKLIIGFKDKHPERVCPITGIENIPKGVCSFDSDPYVLYKPGSKYAERFDLAFKLFAKQTGLSPQFPEIGANNDSCKLVEGCYKIIEIAYREFGNVYTNEKKKVLCAKMLYKSDPQYNYTMQELWFRIQALYSDDTICPLEGSYIQKIEGIKKSIGKEIHVRKVELTVQKHYKSEWNFI